MKFKLIPIFFFIINLFFSQTEKLDEGYVKEIQKLIKLFKKKDIEKISDWVNYPLGREYPIPIIENKNDFKKRFNEIFDKNLVNIISNSKIEDWSEVGWRGIMLNNGIVWIDFDGKIIAVNYQSNFEKNQEKNLIEKQKKKIYTTLQDFSKPVYKIQTKHFLIRIDEMKNGKYRYSSWKINQIENSKPELVLNNGELEFEGSGGNHVITFSNKEYEYKVYRNIIGEENTPDISLEVEKNGKTILSEDGKLILK